MKAMLLVLALGAATPFAHTARASADGPCHFHGSRPASQATVLDCATQRKADLVRTGKLEASWSEARAPAIEQVDGKKGKEWKLTFQNPAAADKAKTTLYMFYTLPGNFIAANFTGK